MIKMYNGLHVKYTLFLPYVNGSNMYLTGFSKNLQILNFMKICPVDRWQRVVHNAGDYTEGQ